MTTDRHIYVGYLALPNGLRKPLLLIVGTIMWGVLFASFAIAFSQRDPGPAVWQSNLESFEGTLFETPYPMLVTDDGETLMIVRMGKFGAQGEGIDGLDGRRVRVNGRILRRDGRRIFELADAGELQSSQPVVEDLGAGTTPPAHETLSIQIVAGEIVGSKCFLGAMKPGDGKPHQVCATLCIAGGIPPMLVSKNQDGSNHYQLILGKAGEPIDDTLVGLIGIPIEATGIAERWGDLEVIRLTKPIRKVNP